MKKILLLGFLFTGITTQVLCQELFKNGDMESQGEWIVANLQIESGIVTVIFGSSAGLPAGGSGKCMEASYTYNQTAGTAQVMIYQPLVLQGGHTYIFRGLFKDISVDLENFWSEFMWLAEKPAEGSDVGGNIFAGFNTWKQGCGKGVNGSIVENSCMGDAARYGRFTVPDSITSEDTLYVGFTVGIWTDASRTFDVLFDSLSLKDSVQTQTVTDAIYANSRLLNIYPNPVANIATINYHVSESSDVKLFIYNILGEKVATLINTRKEAGNHDLSFNSSGLTNGIYFICFEADNNMAKRKFHVLHH